MASVIYPLTISAVISLIIYFFTVTLAIKELDRFLIVIIVAISAYTVLAEVFKDK